jgi:Fur family zinc uptake transcriptional regulator
MARAKAETGIGHRAGRAGRPAAADHDHRACVTRALAAAARICRQRGARLTPLRRQVLELVWLSHRPAGAYELLARLGSRRPAKPPTIYRALDFLVTHGLVHRVKSRNAFVGCAAPGHAAAAEILICADCGGASEIADGSIDRALRHSAARIGFEVGGHMVEAVGRCRACRAGPQGPAA